MTNNWIEKYACINNFDNLFGDVCFLYTDVPHWIFPQSTMYITNSEGKIINGQFMLFREYYVVDMIIHYRSIYVLGDMC